MPATCPTCQTPVIACTRCGRPLTGFRWASLATAGAHAHVHPGCLAAAEVPAGPEALGALFTDWELSRAPSNRRLDPSQQPPGPPPLLTVRCRLLEPVAFGPCGLCGQPRRLHAALRWDDDQLTACRECYEAAYRLGRLSKGLPVRFELEPPP